MKVAAAAADIMLTVVDMNIGNEKNGTLSVPSMSGRKASRTDYTKTHTIGTQSINFDYEKFARDLFAPPVFRSNSRMPDSRYPGI